MVKEGEEYGGWLKIAASGVEFGTSMSLASLYNIDSLMASTF